MITMLKNIDHPIVLERTNNLFHENEDIIIDTESEATCVIQRIKNKPYATYLIDINMPLENRINLARHIKSIQSDYSVILYTGDDIT
ncbi:response regulator, partial [Lysinibacillus sp. D4B1_S16]|uniref:response regulator n=1 Tax=Lysinibacillus sp. D4B1_S16 TaxID=2941231 RepID=UPI0020BF6FB5